ncbi:hypothetical protein [Microtetraspora sp. NBRC 13810]|uniref:hypothetical protein n=1 Tax=Microtetraspora sp. NBRC 13810 TaxID=3030990 RepID=UPI002552DBBD|nr:hypothetical protein [Microtetraspora sp. NBRC 13810]
MQHSHGSRTMTDDRNWSVRRAVSYGELRLELITDGENWAIRKSGNLLCEGYHQEIAYVWDVLTTAIFGPESPS